MDTEGGESSQLGVVPVLMKLFPEREDPASSYLLLFILLREKLLPVPGELLEDCSASWGFIAFKEKPD